MFYYRNPTKYNATKIEINGIKFDSKFEASVYRWLIDQPNIKLIARQKVFIILPKFIYNGQTIREIKYLADFVIEYNGKLYIIETKGFETPEFKLKEKLLFKYLNDTQGQYVYLKINSLKMLKEKLS